MLRADGDPVGDGTAQNLGHGIGIFSGVEIQPGTLSILLQQSLAFQAAPHAFANQLNQFLQLAFVRRLDALKTGRAVVATYVDAIQEQQARRIATPTK